MCARARAPYPHIMSADLPPATESSVRTAEAPAQHHAPQHAVAQVVQRREAFWHNVVRDILNALAVTAASASGRLSPTAGGAATTPGPEHEMFDGRMAVITRLGQRIPIADVYPVFACSVPTGRGTRDRSLAEDIQCSVFQIRTPTGEVYTLPVHEIVSVHALTESLVRQMEAASRAHGESDTSDTAPFGFAAFTSLARSEHEQAQPFAETESPGEP